MTQTQRPGRGRRLQRSRLLGAGALVMALGAGSAVAWSAQDVVASPPATSTAPTASSASSSASSATATTSSAAPFDAVTKHDEEFNKTFKHKFAKVRDVRMHYVTGGTGPPLVLLHGWPQSWYEWRKVMPALAEHHTVYALDLPGLGDSKGSPPGFDKKTLARYVHGLLRDRIGLDEFDLVAHDLGGGVGFQYASQFPDRVRSYVHMDYPLPGRELPAAKYRAFSWHMAFNSQKKIPEQLVDNPGDVREYLTGFYPQVAYGGPAFGGTRTESPFTKEEIDEYVRTYSRPEVMRAGFELYRSLDQDERDNAAARPVDTPTLLLTATGSLAATEPTLKPKFSDLTRAVEIPKSGHWLAEENAEAVRKEILAFTGKAFTSE